jgi:hypothetical protein
MRRSGHEKNSMESKAIQRPLRLLRDPRFQYKLLATQGISLLAYSASLFGVIQYSFGIADDLRRRILLYSALVLLTGMEFLISSIFIINFTNRLFRPIHRIKSYFVKILMREKFPAFDLSFTRAEHFQDLPPVINKAMKKLEEKNEPPSEAEDVA